MSNFHGTGLPLVLGILILFILVFVVPLLSRNVTYRTATLFAGLNAGILVTSLGLDEWSETRSINIEEMSKFLLATLPRFYIASLIIGAAVIPKYVLLAPTQSGAVVSGLLGITAYYFLSLTIPNLAGLLHYIYVNSPLPFDTLWDLLIEMVMRIFRFDRFFTTVMIVSALVSMVATTAIIQKSGDLYP